MQKSGERQSRLAPMLGHDGRLKGDLTVFNWGDGSWWIMGSYYLRQWHMRWFEDHLIEGALREVELEVAFYLPPGVGNRGEEGGEGEEEKEAAAQHHRGPLVKLPSAGVGAGFHRQDGTRYKYPID